MFRLAKVYERQLAVAGSTVLVVLIAAAITLPIFDVANRNARRERDVQAVAEALTAWQDEHKGTLPTAEELDALDALVALSDPDGTRYAFVIESNSAGATLDTAQVSALDHKIYIYSHAMCSGSYPAFTDNAQRFAVFYKLEGTGGEYCVDNSTQ